MSNIVPFLELLLKFFYLCNSSFSLFATDPYHFWVSNPTLEVR